MNLVFSYNILIVIGFLIFIQFKQINFYFCVGL
jgi:hypothetical protein